MSGRSASAGADHRFACVNRVPLFADLAAEDRRRIAEVAVTRRYARGEQVHRPGDESGLRIVHGGRVKVYRATEAGPSSCCAFSVPASSSARPRC